MKAMYSIYILLALTTFVQGKAKERNVLDPEPLTSTTTTTTAEPPTTTNDTNSTTTVKPVTTNSTSTVVSTSTEGTTTAMSTSTNASTSVVTTSTPVTIPTTTPKVTRASDTTTSLPQSTLSPSKDRQFDGLSFMGGIILATSFVAVGVLSWKFYKTRTERNYHTL